MDWFKDLIHGALSIPVLVALLTGGVFVKVLEILASRSKRLEDVRYSERDNLRQDISYLRQEVKQLREEVKALRTTVDNKDKTIDEWQKKYWGLKAKVERLLAYYKEHASEETHSYLSKYISDLEKDTK